MFNVPAMSLGSNIRRYRTTLGLTLEQLSALTNNQVDVGTISALEMRDSKRSQYAPHIARALRISLDQLLDDGYTLPLRGTEAEPETGAQYQPKFTPVPSDEGAIAHSASHQGFETVPSLKWEQLMSEDPKGTFYAEIPDDAMAPRVRAGNECFFRTGLTPRPGAGVLVKDAAGAVHFREYREAAGGAWEAHATNPAYRTLHSQADGLRVIAVLRGVMRGWEEL